MQKSKNAINVEAVHTHTHTHTIHLLEEYKKRINIKKDKTKAYEKIK